MSIRGTVMFECDRKGCYAECVLDFQSPDEINISYHGLSVEASADGWRMDDDGALWCPQCAEPDERDEAYERAAARARNNDFAETDGKDWT